MFILNKTRTLLIASNGVWQALIFKIILLARPFLESEMPALVAGENSETGHL